MTAFFHRWREKISGSYWLKSGLFALMQRLSVSACTITTFLLLVRMLSKEAQGLYDLLMITATIFELFKIALLKNATITLTHNQETHRQQIQSASLMLNAALTGVAVLLIVGLYVVHTALPQETMEMLLFYCPALIMLVAAHHFEIQLLAAADFKSIFWVQLTRHGIIMISVSGLFLSGYAVTVADLALVQSVGVTASAITAWRLARPLILPLSADALFGWAGKILRFGRFVAGTAILSDIARSADRYLVANMAGTAGTALYSVSGRITNLTDLPASAVAEISFPKTVRAMAEEGKESVANLFEWSVAANWVFLLPVSLLIILLPEPVLRIVAGAQYTEAAPILQWMLATGLLLPFMRQFGNTMDAIGKPHLNFYINLLIAACCIAAELTLLSLAGRTGAAMGLFVGMSVGCGFAYATLRKYVPIRIAGVAMKTFNIYKQSFAFLFQKLKPTHE
ncbi:oligosaccharide flippase family protein [Rhodoflexus caldus]|uniref:oligosaccharide flippase family protein n=1 Tax=Rhodoflexus caldus TaxID=2891236 RepID=UPI00202A14C3|nr:oligosaccharide flippase family protein [Rhodoflexus caldus]